MAKQRIINTRFWNDSYIASLDPVEKLLFIYFLTNEHTNICGVYEVPMKIIAVETGIDREMIPKIIKRFTGKVHYIDGWVFIKNFTKHQSTTSETVQKAIENGLAELPNEIKAKIDKLYPMDTLSIPYNISKSKSKLKSKPKEAVNGEGKEVNDFITLFKKVNPSYQTFFKNKTQRGAAARLLKTHGKEKIDEIMVALPVLINRPFYPKITSPYELERDLGKLIAANKQDKGKVAEQIKSKAVFI